MRKPLTPTEAAMLATFIAPTADQPRSVPQTTVKPHKLQLVRNDDDDPAPGGGVVDLTKLALGVQATRDPDLMNLLVKESMPRILATARRKLRDKSLVEDCGQDVADRMFVRGGLERFDDKRGSFATYLVLVTRDFARRLNRKNAARPATPTSTEVLDQVAGEDTSATFAAELRELGNDVWRKIATLEAKDQAIVVLRVWQGKGWSQIALALRLPRGTVTSRWVRHIRPRLQSELWQHAEHCEECEEAA